MTDPDVEYLRAMARGYSASFVGDWEQEWRRLNAIADRLEAFVQAQAAEKEAGWTYERG